MWLGPFFFNQSICHTAHVDSRAGTVTEPCLPCLTYRWTKAIKIKRVMGWEGDVFSCELFTKNSNHQPAWYLFSLFMQCLFATCTFLGLCFVSGVTEAKTFASWWSVCLVYNSYTCRVVFQWYKSCSDVRCKRSSPETMPEETLAEAQKASAKKRQLLNVSFCLFDVPSKVKFLQYRVFPYIWQFPSSNCLVDGTGTNQDASKLRH